MTQKHPSRGDVVNRLTSRAWREPSFRDVLFNHPRTALVEEFGFVPQGFEDVTFAPREVDRAVIRSSSDGNRFVVRPKRGDRPLSVLVRQVFGIPELVMVFYTKRCQYQCSFCTLPATSAYTEISSKSIEGQLSYAFAQAGPLLAHIKQISIGNEGSILDRRTFSHEQLAHVMNRCAELPSVEEIVLETRAEFASEELLDEVRGMVGPLKLSLKIGLESADDEIRERILHKRMALDRFEAVVELLGRKRVGLATYVLVKAHPAHSDSEGRDDAIKTCEYVKRLCRRYDTALTLRINAMYRAKGSHWARWAEEARWTPPSIFDIAEVMMDVHDNTTRVYAGLSEEGLATRDGHYEARPDFEHWALSALERYNETGDIEVLRQVACHRCAA